MKAFLIGNSGVRQTTQAFAKARAMLFDRGIEPDATRCRQDIRIALARTSGIADQRARSRREEAARAHAPVAGIPWSRLALSAHYATDVLGGLLLGAGWLALMTAFLHHVPEARFL
jgi:hypothetical protein